MKLIIVISCIVLSSAKNPFVNQAQQKECKRGDINCLILVGLGTTVVATEEEWDLALISQELEANVAQQKQDNPGTNWNDPAVKMNALQLANSQGYAARQYSVKTEDGFILGVQRIEAARFQTPAPRGVKRGPPILLQHGLFGSSVNWVSEMWNESLAFILADNGYDVWLGNDRGNTYSRRNVHLKQSQKEFWQWSFDEMAQYDLPATVNYIIEQTGYKSIYYVGHSQGTLIGFLAFSANQQFWNDKIRAFFALAPVATVGNILSPIKNLAKYATALDVFFNAVGYYNFLPENGFLETLRNQVCPSYQDALDHAICKNTFFFFSDPPSSYANQSRAAVHLSHFPAGTSTQNVAHFLQLINSNKCQKYDRGLLLNKVRYGKSSPPEYQLNKIRIPTVLFHGGKDVLADPVDVDWLKGQISSTMIGDYYYENYTHNDFIIAINAGNIVYDKILNIIGAMDQEHDIEMIRKELLANVAIQKSENPGPNWNDPAVTMDALQLANSQGYPASQYDVITEDGFVLGVHRIEASRFQSPYSSGVRRGPPVLLQHGLLGSSVNWVSEMWNESLAFILADNGYDVWLGNVRGNTYSKRNLYLKQRQKEFWQWSFDEMAQYDLPAMANYIIEKTGYDRIYYAGHSQGTLIGFIAFSTNQQFWNDKIRAFFALAPIGTIGNIQSSIKNLAPYASILDGFFNAFGYYDFLPENGILHKLRNKVCMTYQDAVDLAICKKTFLMSNTTSEYQNKSRAAVHLSHFPAGTSAQNVAHYLQMINSNKCQRFDQGFLLNKIKYGQSSPPEYPLNTLQVPTALFTGGKDVLADPIDVSWLKGQISSTLIGDYYYENYTHNDFVIAINAGKIVYNKILNLMLNY